jgi:hypothetical protein
MCMVLQTQSHYLIHFYHHKLACYLFTRFLTWLRKNKKSAHELTFSITFSLILERFLFGHIATPWHALNIDHVSRIATPWHPLKLDYVSRIATQWHALNLEHVSRIATAWHAQNLDQFHHYEIMKCADMACILLNSFCSINILHFINVLFI